MSSLKKKWDYVLALYSENVNNIAYYIFIARNNGIALQQKKKRKKNSNT